LFASFMHFFFQAEDGIRGFHVTGVQTCALPIYFFQSGIELHGPAYQYHGQLFVSSCIEKITFLRKGWGTAVQAFFEIAQGLVLVHGAHLVVFVHHHDGEVLGINAVQIVHIIMGGLMDELLGQRNQLFFVHTVRILNEWNYEMDIPPSVARTTPVVHVDSEFNNRVALATMSDTSPRRFKGMPLRSLSWISK